MNWALIHLAVNHVPVLGTALVFIVLSGAILKRNEGWVRTALTLFVVIAVLTVPVYLTGEPAEGVVEHLAGVTEPLIVEHEEAAEAALIVVGLSGIFSLAALFLFRPPKRLPTWVMVLSFAASLMSASAMARTAYLGGHIRHEETRPEFKPAGSNESPWSSPSSHVL